MSLITAKNEFGNTVAIRFENIKAVKERNGIFQVLYPNAVGEQHLLFLTKPNKPALLRGIEANTLQTSLKDTSTKRDTRCRTNYRSLRMNRVPYLKVYEAHASV